MTRDEFIESINNIYQLEDFCYDEGCSACEDVRDEDSFCEWVDDSISDWLGDYSWRDLADKLIRFDDMRGEDRYIWDDWDCEYRPLTDSDFDNLKNEVLEWGDNNDFWDHDEEDEGEREPEPEPEIPQDPEDSIPTPDEEFSIGEMFAAGAGIIRAFREEERMAEMEDERSFAEFTSIGR